MPISVSGTQITFNDATVQTTAATGGVTGASGQVFNANGTFTIPTGITALKVTVLGGGGGGTGVNPGCCGNLVPGNTGGTSSIASGTQSISTVSATGGATSGNNGNGSGGDLNYAAGNATFATRVTSFAGGASYGAGGVSTVTTPAGAGGTAIKYLTGLTPGGTLAVTRGAGGNPGTGSSAGLGGFVLVEW